MFATSTLATPKFLAKHLLDYQSMLLKNNYIDKDFGRVEKPEFEPLNLELVSSHEL